jgi:hypothetical protein
MEPEEWIFFCILFTGRRKTRFLKRDEFNKLEGWIMGFHNVPHHYQEALSLIHGLSYVLYIKSID